MESWNPVDVPSLPGSGQRLQLFDSATQALRDTTPAGSTATMYVCGITPYDATHLGHAATYVTFDLINRAWRDQGLTVRYVQNVTDIDDPLLERARATGVDWEQIAGSQTQLFREDMTALRVLPPEAYVGAVESIPLVVSMVQELQRRGAVYDVDGDLYFAVTSDPTFGSVSGATRPEMAALFAERGGDPERDGKKDPLDCLLWQAPRPGEPSWESELGPGRPGWHIECSAIALEYLGAPIDVQGGGSDLIFPHHEMSAAEAQVATGTTPFARTYVHAGMVGLDGEKMSKSRGNLVFVSQLRHRGVTPMAIRLALLSHHYRTDWEWTEGDLSAAIERLALWQAGVARPTAAAAEPVLAAIRERLAHDLDTPTALQLVDKWARQDGPDPAAPELMRTAIDALLGIRC